MCAVDRIDRSPRPLRHPLQAYASRSKLVPKQSKEATDAAREYRTSAEAGEGMDLATYQQMQIRCTCSRGSPGVTMEAGHERWVLPVGWEAGWIGPRCFTYQHVWMPGLQCMHGDMWINYMSVHDMFSEHVCGCMHIEHALPCR